MKDFLLILIDALEGDYGWMTELAAIVVFVIIFNIILKWLLLKLHERLKGKGDIWKDCLVVALIKPLTSIVWLIAAIQALNFFCIRCTAQALITSHHAVIKSGLIVATAWFFLRWKKLVVKRLVERGKESEEFFDHGKIDAIDKILTLVIYLIAALLLLEQTGSSMNTLIAFGGVSGLAVAFASQQIIANFFGGVMIYLTQPFTVGEWILLPEKDIEGHVEEIGWYTTMIRTLDKQPIYVPNSMLTNILVTNYSRMTHRQFKQTLSLRSQDLPAFPAIIQDLKKLFHDHPKIDQHQHPRVHFGALGPVGFEIHISAYTTITDKKGFEALVQDLLYHITAIISNNNAEFAVSTSAIEFPKGFPPISQLT